jgi:hypothetical protein
VATICAHFLPDPAQSRGLRDPAAFELGDVAGFLQIGAATDTHCTVEDVANLALRRCKCNAAAHLDCPDVALFTGFSLALGFGVSFCGSAIRLLEDD